jgi:glycosyltransferase involved in cell wall biosynthesis
MPDRRALVVHLITRLELGGAQQNTLFCVAHHDRALFRAALWAGAGGLLDDDARSLADADVRLFPWLVHPIRPHRDALALRRLASVLREVRPGLLHTHSSKAGILGRLAAPRRLGTRVVHTVHGWSFNDTQPAPVRRLYQVLERLAARRTDRIVCVSERDRQAGLALGIGEPGAYRIVRSGIDPFEFSPSEEGRRRVRAELGVGPGEILVGSLACLKPQKAPLDFVSAAAAAGSAEPRLRFALAGDGELRPAVEEALRATALGTRFHVLGWRRDVRDLLSAFDLFVLTSRFEGLPRAVLQAMVAGVPVVATAVGGTPEVVEDGRTGRLVAPGDPEGVARALLGLAADRDLRERTARAARARIDEEFDIRGMVRSLDRLYAELLAGPSPVGIVPERV